MPVPNSFASATTSIPLSQLDQNFNTPITLGNTAIQLGNTVTTLNNMTLANATVSSGNVTVTSASLSGNLTFTGTGNRITGDFSNATVANRVIFQTSTTNGNTVLNLIPNGTGTVCAFGMDSDPALTNSSTGSLNLAAGTDVRLTAGIRGTGSYLPMTFYTGGSERMRVDTSGYILGGYSSAFDMSPAGTGQYAQISASSASANWKFGALSFSADNTANGLLFIKSRSATVGTNTVVQSGDALGNIVWRGGDGTNYINAAAIQAWVDGTPGTNDMPGRITFSTTADGSSSITERMRIDSSGNVGIGTSSPGVKLDVSGDAIRIQKSVNPIYYAYDTRDIADAAGYWQFQSNGGGSGTVQAYMAMTQQSTSSQGGNILFATNGGSGATERARIDSSGNLLVGTTTSQGRLTVQTATATAGTRMVAFSDSNGRFSGFYEGADGTGFNAANTVFGVRSTTGTGRSINASGTVNASGADYAEYMLKSGDFTIAKGDICGINSEGKLTNVFAEAVTFVVKSTNPSYVGGDTWGVGIEDLETLEAARQAVDRIAFAGQVPVNVLGTTSGQYIIPVNENGVIKGEAVSNPTFEQYQIAVGKVIAIEEDGRARIIVKVA